ncbi:hypothetical protein [Massilia timonae]|uniref:hypothetical protein n=1 Tax=Massilia timonae TaxID=47229 RepID=UPI0028A072AD|nr:hypothetical protein [Massilia timonae]
MLPWGARAPVVEHLHQLPVRDKGGDDIFQHGCQSHPRHRSVDDLLYVVQHQLTFAVTTDLKPRASASLGQHISFNAHIVRRNLKLYTGMGVIGVAADFNVDVFVLVGKFSEIPASGAGLPTV